jgi:LysR family transcriptional regulator, benzoate and cis,cis-muconate-responsive activator of ben and cat genes
VMGAFVREADLQYTELFDDPLVAAISMQHPLAGRETLAASDLETLPYISYPKDANSHFSRQVLALLDAAGARPQVGYEAKEIHTALGLVAAGLGTTVVGRSVAAHNRTDVRFLPLAGVPTSSKVLAVRKAGASNPLTEAFLEIVRTQVPA